MLGEVENPCIAYGSKRWAKLGEVGRSWTTSESHVALGVGRSWALGAAFSEKKYFFLF